MSKVADIACFWGTPYLDTDGVWKCPSSPLPNVLPSTRRTITDPTPVYTVPPVWNTAITQTSIMDWVKGHPFIIAGGLALFVWLLFFRGGGKLAGKIRTDVTRWGS